jgi:predicted RNase H-related nuclease YkuK (DUF458 family)
MINEALEHITEDTKVFIGCYSSVTKGEATYIVALIVYRKNFCKVFKTLYKLPDYGNIKARMLQEASFAINTAIELGVPAEIHLDINPNPRFKSNAALKEALAYVRGMGLQAKVKPEAFAASCAADYFT